MAMTRLLFASDFHGSDACFRKFIRAGLMYEAQVLLVGGDVTGKAIVPLKHKGGTYEGYLFGHKYVASTDKELVELKKLIANVGFYPLELEPEEAQELESDPQRIDEVFVNLMMDTLAKWMELAEEHLAPKGIKMYFMPGNDDSYAIDEVIEASTFVINPDGRKVWIDDNHEMIGLSNANMTPWNCPRDISEEEMATKIEQLVREVRESSGLEIPCTDLPSAGDVIRLLEQPGVDRSGAYRVMHERAEQGFSRFISALEGL